MMMLRRSVGLAVLCFGLCSLAAFGQLVDPAQPSSGQGESLADIARRVRKDHTTEEKTTTSDSKKLFDAVDKVFTFASEDTGLPKRSVIKRQMVDKAEVEKFTRGRLEKEEVTQRFATAELSMKKLGFLPRDFNLREFLVKSSGQQVAGYYDEDTKTISLVNWVPFDQQGPILAHELTHALQDQNYDLKKWMQSAEISEKHGNSDDSAIARKAVVEGQAMVVYVDYMLAAVGRTLQDTPGLLYQMEEPAVKAVIDSQLLHDAPAIMREMGTFSYQDGLIFTGELLHKGGKKMAFAGAFARPPKNSHEILQPEAYIKGLKVAPVRIPDMERVLGKDYEVYDSGGIGELDVRALLKQYGERKNANDLAAYWKGGAYVTYRRGNHETSASSPTTSDLAFLYVSHWSTPKAAERFASFYAKEVGQRYQSATSDDQVACGGGDCPVSRVEISTEEGPVIVEQWTGNRVVISEGFDKATSARLRGAIRDSKTGEQARGSKPHRNSNYSELGFRLAELPAFQDFQAAIGARIREGITPGRGR